MEWRGFCFCYLQNLSLHLWPRLDHLMKFEPTSVTVSATDIPLSKTASAELLRLLEIILRHHPSRVHHSPSVLQLFQWLN
jgi:hypothetical protein